MIDIGQFHRVADPQGSAVRLFLTDQHAEQGGFTRAVRADHANDAAFGQLEVETVDQQAVAEAFAQLRRLHDQLAEPGAGWNVEFLGFIALLEFLRFQFFKAGQTGFALGMAALGIGAHPFQFRLHRLGMRGFLLLLDLQALFLLFQPGGIIAFPGDALTAIQFENPAGHVVEEVAVMGDGNHRTGIVLKETLQPGHGFGVEMIGRFVEQQHVGLGEQQAAQGDPPALAAGQLGDIRLPGRQAQGVGGNIQSAVEIMAVRRLQVGLQVGLFGSQFLEIGVRIGVGGVDLVQPGLRGLDRFDGLFDIAAHVLGRIELRFLRQKADFDSSLRAGLAENLGIEAGHDAQQGGFARAVQAEDANLGPGEEGQGNVLENFPLGRHDFAHAVHGVDVLGHANGSSGVVKNKAVNLTIERHGVKGGGNEKPRH